MTIREVQTEEGTRIELIKSKEYFLTSVLIICAFLGVNYLGYLLNIMDVFVVLVLFSLFFLFTLVVIRYSDRLETVSIEKWGKTFRKYSHLIGGFVMLFFAVFSSLQLSWICLSILVAFVLHEYFYVKKNIYGVYTKTLIFVGRLDRRQTPESPNPRPFYPTLWLLASIAVIGLFGQNIAIAAVVTFAFGDFISTIVGERIGRHKLPYNKTKSVEGSLAFFGLTFLMVFTAFMWGGHYFWLAALLSATVGSVTESLIPTNYWLDDNFVVPVSVALVLFIAGVF